MIKRTQYIDENTGEICADKARFISAAFDEEKGYLFWVRKNFAKSFQDVDFPSEMSFTEIGRMAKLAKKIWSNTNMLGYRGHGGIKPYNVEMIGEVIGLKPRQAARFVDKMIRLGVMAKVTVQAEKKREVHYYINPLYFFSSNRLPLNLYLIFRNQLDPFLPNWVIHRFNEQNSSKEDK